jgi:uncharacterized OsmC-like protein
MSTRTTNVVNGVDRDALFGALDAVKGSPELAEFQFRARNTWVLGTHSRTTIEDFAGLGGELTHTRAFTLEGDHPEHLTGKDNAPTPVEFLLHALAACITAGIGNIAAARGIELTRVTSTVEGDIDLNGLLGLDTGVRNGYRGIRIRFEIEGDAGSDQLKQVVERSVARSAVFDVLTNGVDVQVEVAA